LIRRRNPVPAFGFSGYISVSKGYSGTADRRKKTKISLRRVISNILDKIAFLLKAVSFFTDTDIIYFLKKRRNEPYRYFRNRRESGPENTQELPSSMPLVPGQDGEYQGS